MNTLTRTHPVTKHPLNAALIAQEPHRMEGVAALLPAHEIVAGDTLTWGSGLPGSGIITTVQHDTDERTVTVTYDLDVTTTRRAQTVTVNTGDELPIGVCGMNAHRMTGHDRMGAHGERIPTTETLEGRYVRTLAVEFQRNPARVRDLLQHATERDLSGASFDVLAEVAVGNDLVDGIEDAFFRDAHGALWPTDLN